MAMKPWVLGGIGALVLGLSAGSIGAQTPPPKSETPPPKAEKSEAAACIDCHDAQGKSFPTNPHTRIRGAEWGKPGVGNATCSSCHGPGTKHMESSGEDKSDIRVLKGRKGADFCLTCHTSNKPHASYNTSVHASSEAVNCLSCHSIHSSEPKEAHLLVKQSSEVCATCHVAQAASFRNKPFKHRIGKGGMDCASCHEPHGLARDKALRLTRVGEMPCLNCHAEKRGPFVFEHVNGVVGTCVTCHEPHGSSNNKRLVRARVDRLCLECHSNLSTATLGSQPPAFHDVSLPRWQNCTTCHVAVHGSNVSPQLFK
jgi:DmsE family decaheme c-type cytochrome